MLYFVLLVSLQSLWSMLNSQQLMMHFALLSGMQYPANSAIFNIHMIDVVTFELVPSDFIEENLH